MDEDKSREWEKVKPWLLDLRRHRISPVLVHHTGYDLTHMRGTSSREDAASWVIRLDSKKDDFETLGAKFISRFTKYRGKEMVLDYEWTFEPGSAVGGLGQDGWPLNSSEYASPPAVGEG